MGASFRKLEDLPRRNATQVKNRWSDVVREVRTSGSVAVTSHDRIEMVVVDAGRYREMEAIVQETEQRRKAAIAELTAEFDQHLASLRKPGTRKKIDDIFSSDGNTRVRPKAGPSF